MLRRLVGLFTLLTTALLGQTAGPIVQTFAGTQFTFQSEGQPATSAPLGRLSGVDLDPSGNLLIADLDGFRVFQLDSMGAIRTIGGNGFRYIGACCQSGRAASVALAPVYSILSAPDGSVYVGATNIIQRISPDGTISTVAGNYVNSGSIGDGGPAIRAQVSNIISSMAFDPAGNLVFADYGNYRIRRIDANGIITTIAGNGQINISGEGVPATQAGIGTPTALRYDAAGNLYISNNFGRLRRISPDGIITNFTNNQFASLNVGFDVDTKGNLYIADGISRVLRVTPDGSSTVTIAGTTVPGYSGDGGPATLAQLNQPSGVRLDAAGNVFIADGVNGRIRKIGPDGTITTVAGNGEFQLSRDGVPAALSFFAQPQLLAFSPEGNLHIGDGLRKGTVYRVEKDGTLTRAAGTGTASNAAVRSGTPALSTTFSVLSALAFNSRGSLFIADGNRDIRRLEADGSLTIYAGGGFSTADGIPATQAQLAANAGMVFDKNDNLYFFVNGRIRKVTPNGTITTLAGAHGISGFQDGQGASARFALGFGAQQMAIDAAGNLLYADLSNSRVRKITPDGTVTTFAGGGTSNAASGGLATSVSLGLVWGVAVEPSGSVLISGSSVVYRVTADGRINVVAGTGAGGYSGDGGPARQATFLFLRNIAVDPAGSIFLADGGNYRVRVLSASTPRIAADTTALSFTVNAGGSASAPQQLAVSGSVVGIPFTVTSSNGFLVTSAASGITPATIDVSVNPASLTVGDTTGRVTITPAVAGAAPVTVTVAVKVNAALPAQLSLDSTALTYSFERGGAAAVRRLQLTNAGGSTSYRASASAPWLSVTPATGTVSAATPAALAVTADPAGLRPGTYSATVTVAGAAGGSFTVPVTMSISNAPQLIVMGQTGLTFTAVVNGASTPAQFVPVLSNGSGSFDFTTRAITPADAPQWLSASPASGTSGGTIRVAVDPSGLNAGIYYGRIEVASTTADNSPQQVTVVLNLLAEGTNPGPIVQPSGLVFTAVAQGADPPSQTVTVSNITNTPVSFGSGVATLDGGRYFAYQPQSSALPPGSVQIVVQPSITGVAAGVYRGVITLVFADGSVRTISILMVIAPAGTVLPANKRETTAASGCTPTRLLPLVTSLGAGFNVPAAFPTAVTVRVVDDCGTPIVAGSVSASFSNGDPPLRMTSLRDGNWSGTWLSRNTNLRQVTITVNSEQTPSIRGSIQVTGGLSGDSDPPVIRPGAIVNAASLGAQGLVAPGAMIRIYGTRLSQGQATAGDGPVDVLLAGTTVIAAGRALPLFAASDDQVVAQMPFDIPVNVRTQLIVSRGNSLSVPEEITVAATQPAIFAADGSGQGQGRIFVTKDDGSLVLADRAAPAKPGDSLVIYCSGLGAVDQPVADGQPAPASPAANALAPVTVTFGSVQVKPAFAGLAPGFVGLYWVQATMPSGAGTGDAIPVVLTSGEQVSPPVTMAASQ